MPTTKIAILLKKKLHKPYLFKSSAKLSQIQKNHNKEIKRACDTIKTYCDNDALPLESEEKVRILLLANKIKTFSEFSSIDIDTLK